ncbi:MAG: alpha/beta hydrolase [Parasphingorhabdus sp.]|nr:alpha/beta hydrolase [Parasphingorhabdus sp.]
MKRQSVTSETVRSNDWLILPADLRESSWIAPDGWVLRRCDWQAKPPVRGNLLFLTGRADFYEKYLETFADFVGAGWNITSFDWRGQGGSGRITRDPLLGHIADFSIWVADLADFFADWSAHSDGPRVVIAHSLGGHILLRALAERELSPDAAIFAAPMILPEGNGLPPRIAHGLAQAMCALGRAEKFAWKRSLKPLEPESERQKLLTHDFGRYAQEHDWLERRPELALGPPSWRWVERAYASGRALCRQHSLRNIATPALFFATPEDRLVDSGAIVQATESIPAAKLHLFDHDCAHEIFRESDNVRDVAIAESLAFLDSAPR